MSYIRHHAYTFLFGIFQINTDFELLYPQSHRSLMSKFPRCKTNIKPLLVAAVTKSVNCNKTEILKDLHDIDRYDDITSDFLILYYLPLYLKPSKRIKTNSRDSKPTIAESQQYFIQLIRVSS